MSTSPAREGVQALNSVTTDLFPGAKVTLLEALVPTDDTIVSFDPGRTTGIVVARGTTWIAAETPELRLIWSVLRAYRPHVILFERFHAESPAANDEALDVRGVVKLYRALVTKPNVPPQIWWQPPSCKDVEWLRGDKLKNYKGLWIPGEGHDCDAIRHLLWHLIKRCGHKELLSWSKT